MMTSTKRNNFTLLEVVVATSLLGMVGLLIAMSASSFQRSWEHGRKTAFILERNLAIDRIADTVIRSMISFTWPNREAGTEMPVFSGETDELYLAALNRSYGGKSPFRFVRLYVEDSQFKCDYSDTPLLPWLEAKDQNFRTEVIAPGVDSLTFRYATENEDGELVWLETWTYEEQTTLPLAVQMTLEYLDGTKQRWLRRKAGNSYNTEVLENE